MSDPAKKAASRAASRKIAVALRGLSYDDAYSLLSGHLHAVLIGSPTHRSTCC